ncbi:hypothetical protein SLEP1_g30281 [Rubroshorea leprosula]|uniref:Uncharacterized protein n=1 Tax=Rubroshorea leprosula TaxID=152421 RepID=A0AAV5K8A3_9ROSI|nr:hypothetical protein SLEP1_g30281 [Rubroshorea leprosula]
MLMLMDLRITSHLGVSQTSYPCHSVTHQRFLLPSVPGVPQ